MMIRRALYSLGLIVFSFSLFSQVFWTEDFGTGCNHTTYVTTNGTWTVNNTVGLNGADQNQWYLSAQESGNNAGTCGTGCVGAGDKSLHIGSAATVLGDIGAAYLNGGLGFWFPETHTRIESPVINCTGQNTITLSFNYIENGDGLNDNAEVWYFDGASWTMLFDMAKTVCCGGPCDGSTQGQWTAFSMALPASANNNPNVQIGFYWYNNDDGVGTDPSIAIDDIQLSIPVTGTAPVASFTASADTICVNNSIQFTDASTNTPTSWLWSTNPATGVTINTAISQNPSMTFVSAGTFSVVLIATNATGSDSDTMVVTILPLPTVIASTSPGFNDSICFGDTTQLLASGALSYSWNMNEGLSDSTISNPVFDSTITSTYIVTGSDANGCQNNDTITITVLNPPAIVASTSPGFNDTICTGDTTQLLASGGVSYTWNMNEGLSDSTISNPVFDSTITSTYIVTGVDAAGCQNNDTITIAVLNFATITVSVAPGFNDTICPGDTTQLLASGGATYTWNMNEGLSDSTIANPVFDSTITSTYIVTGTTAGGCVNTDTITITVLTVPAITASVAAGFNDSICQGDTTQLLASGGLTYNWNMNEGLSDSTIANPVFDSTITTTYIVSGTNASGCSNSDTITITVLNAPIIIASVAPGFNDSICSGDTTQLLASGGVTYTWNMNQGLSDSTISNPVFDSTVTSIYIVTGSDAIGCQNSDTITITVLTPPTVSVVSPVTICENETVMLSASGATNYSWSPSTFLSDSLIANPLFTGTTSTNYTVTGTTALGCSDAAVVNITVFPASVASATTGTIPVAIPATVSFTNTSLNADSILWSFGDGSTDTTSNPSHTYTAAGTYTVSLIAYNANGCNDTTSFTITISATSSLTIPNFFSPNFDDVNDVFRPENIGIKTFYCVVYDRWGLKMYEWDRPQGWWDGRTTAGMECPEGVYYFIIKATGYDGKEYEETGYLHLFR